jgi:hypothetical protein
MIVVDPCISEGQFWVDSRSLNIVKLNKRIGKDNKVVPKIGVFLGRIIHLQYSY